MDQRASGPDTVVAGYGSEGNNTGFASPSAGADVGAGPARKGSVLPSWELSNREAMNGVIEIGSWGAGGGLTGEKKNSDADLLLSLLLRRRCWWVSLMLLVFGYRAADTER